MLMVVQRPGLWNCSLLCGYHISEKRHTLRLESLMHRNALYVPNLHGVASRHVVTSKVKLLKPYCTVLLENPTGSQLVKKFPAFYGTRRFITAFTGVCHLPLSWASSIESIPPHPTSWRSILLSSHLLLGLPSGHLIPGFPTKTLYKPFFSPIRATCPAHLILAFFLPDQYWVRK
jgi:hypothetical protein